MHLLVCDEVFVLSFTVTKMVHQGWQGCSRDFCQNDERMRKRVPRRCAGECSHLWPAGPGRAAWSARCG